MADQQRLCSNGLASLHSDKVLVYWYLNEDWTSHNPGYWYPQGKLVAMALSADGCTVRYGKYKQAAVDHIDKPRWTKMIIGAEVIREYEDRQYYEHWGWIVSAYVERLYSEPPSQVVRALEGRCESWRPLEGRYEFIADGRRNS